MSDNPSTMYLQSTPKERQTNVKTHIEAGAAGVGGGWMPNTSKHAVRVDLGRSGYSDRDYVLLMTPNRAVQFAKRLLSEAKRQGADNA